MSIRYGLEQNQQEYHEVIVFGVCPKLKAVESQTGKVKEVKALPAGSDLSNISNEFRMRRFRRSISVVRIKYINISKMLH